ncbi:VanZ family protein [Saccharopolyspora antimicrobica]|uniref:VanZ family protein n=1 Tax=Saccharopolyspora antimicrobica TaxID=455193 RepID=UPI000A87094B|nr:VanZ family protein [Saccharopolyspora antimicrobica]
MQQVLVAFDGFAPVVTVLLPLSLAVGLGSAVARAVARSGPDPREPLLDGALAYSALCVGYLVFLPQPPAAEPVRPSLGKDVSMALTAGPGDVLPWVQLAGNVLLLVPLAVLAPQRLPWFDSVVKIAFAGLLLSVSIELIQFLAVPGRVAATDDVVCNTIGAAVGGILARLPHWVGSRPQHSASGRAGETVWVLIAKVEQERECSASSAHDEPRWPGELSASDTPGHRFHHPKWTVSAGSSRCAR